MIAVDVAIILILLMAAVTLIGRHLARLLPYRIRPRAVLYLSPALGLSLLVLVCSHVGRFVGFATLSTAIAAVMAGSAVLAWMCERRRAEAALHAAIVAAVSFAAGSAILMCVWRFGGFDSANDAFTYLAHGNWLQTHAFMDTIAPRDIEPYSSQIALYQQAGFRMGASYLLGWVQAMAGLQWSYLAYPVVISAAASAFSFATVFAASLFVRVRPFHGYLLACIPGTSAGSLVFAQIKGFLPQALGSAIALAFLALAGALLGEFARPPGSLSRTAYWRAGLILGGLLAVAVAAYSEQSPLVGAGALLAAGIIAMAPANRLQLMKLMGVSLVAATVLLNIEAFRAVRAIIGQSNVVVGWPVDWSIIEYVAHAVGVHGGNGDAVEWIGGWPSLDIALMIGFAGLILWTWRHPKRGHITIALPLLCFGGLCVVAFLYFRYLVPSPFGVGKGQSWNQFKLTNWVYPVVAVLIAATLARLISGFRSGLVTAVLAVALMDGLLRNYTAAASRMMPITNQLGTDHPIFETLLNVRANVVQHLRPGEIVYLDLRGEFIKLRQLLAYMLYDVHVTANWQDDGYIFPHVPAERRNPSRGLATYVITTARSAPAALRQKMAWRIGSIGMIASQDDRRYVAIDAVEGGYDRESDDARWWFWVRDQIAFTLDQTDGDQDALGRHISFEYWMTGQNNLSLEVIGTNDRLELTLPPPPGGKGSFEKTLAPSFGRIQRVTVRADGEPVRLGPNDGRMAKFLIANLEVETMFSNASAKSKP